MRAEGIDIAKWQGIYDQDEKKWYAGFTNKQNADFIIQKATDGLGVDACYFLHLPEVKKTELRGAYHYFRTAYDPKLQAKNLIDTTEGQGFLVYVMDYEHSNNDTLDDEAEANFWIFYQELLSLTDIPIWLYTTEYTFRDSLLAYRDDWADVPFWVARYKPSLNEQTADPLFLDIEEVEWIMWQYTSEGDGDKYGVSSTFIDLNVFNGTLEELRELLVSGSGPGNGDGSNPPDDGCCAEIDIRLLKVEVEVNQIDDLWAANDRRKTQILDVKEQVEAIDLEPIKTDIVSVTNIANDNFTRLGNTRTELGELVEKVLDIESKQTQLERAIGNQASQISKLTSTLDVCKDDMELLEKGVEARIVEIKADVESIGGKLDRLSTRLRMFELIRKLFRPDDGNNM